MVYTAPRRVGSIAEGRVIGGRRMDWSRTKTIFILTFLVLNLFLGFQLYEKHKENQFEYLSESTVKIEDQLKNMEITYPELPEAPKRMVHITGETHMFTEEELSRWNEDELSINVVEENTKITAVLENDRKFSNNRSDRAAFLQTYPLFGDEYMFWEDGQEENVMEWIFLQTHKERPIYQKAGHSNGQLLVQLNEEGRVVGFEQTYLDIKPQENEQEILTPLKAINQLLMNSKLNYRDEITSIELGYYTLVEGEVQVLAPTWFVEVNDERQYFVNAINGQIDDPNMEAPIETGEG